MFTLNREKNMKIAIGIPGDLKNTSLTGSGFLPFIENVKSALSQHETVICSPRGGNINLKSQFLESNDFMSQYNNTLALAKEFAQKVKELNPDIVIAFTNMGLFLNKKHIYFTTSLPYKHALKLIEGEYPENIQFKELTKYYQFIAEQEYQSYEKAELILTTSIKVKEAIIEEYNINPDKIIYIPLPIYTLIDIGNKNKSHKSNMKLILMPAELRVRKGLRYAIETMKILKEKIPNAVLIICGKINEYENEYIQELLQKAKGKANMIVAGFLPRKQYYQYMKSVECAFLPVLCEGQCEALAECIASGLPVVTNKYTQYNKDIINTIGYCASYKDIKDYANGLIKLLTDSDYNKEKREGTKIIANKYSFENFKRLLNNAIEEFRKT